MTVEVETSEGLKTGSSVYQVTGVGSYDLVSGGKGSSTNLRGEALPVDLPNGQTLFALLRLSNATSDDDNLAIMSMRAMDPAFTNVGKDQSARRIASDENIMSPVVVARENYPLLVTFADVRDPTTIRKVDLADIEATLGPELKLRRILVEVTTDIVTVGIEKRLRWLPNVYRMGLDASFKPQGIPVGNFRKLFSTELEQ